MKSHLKLLGILAVIAYAVVGPGSANAQLQWTVVSPVPTSNNLQSITYGNGQYVAVGDAGTILTSPDGLVWTSRTSGITTRLWSVTYGNGLYVTVGDSGGGSGRILTSANGVSWMNRVSGTSNNLVSLTYGNGLYVAGGERWYKGISDSESMRISSNGITWSRDTTTGLAYGNSLAYLTYSNGLYIVLTPYPYYSDPIHYNVFFMCDIFASSDCKNWTKCWTTPIVNINQESEYFTSVTYGNGRWIAVGGEDVGGMFGGPPTDHSATSLNGITWDTTSVFAHYNIWYTSVTYGNGLFVAVGDGGVIYTSLDGLTDTVNVSGATSNLNSVIYGNGLFVAVGNNGTILTSSTTAVRQVQTTPLLASVLTVQAHNNLLTISLPSAMLGKAVDLAVYSVSGQEIMRKRVQSGAEMFTVPVNLSYGSYILVANDGSRKSSIRFVAVR
ncbi:MAG: hypothetical protein ABSF80_05630 [Chitinispirillaceae bacterium]|jgi:hypothetical protein